MPNRPTYWPKGQYDTRVTEKTCCRCKETKPAAQFFTTPYMKDGLRSQCKPCHQALTLASADYETELRRSREWHRKARAEGRIKTTRRTFVYGEKERARKAVASALKSGRLIRPNSCGACGKACKPDAHHADYSQPLAVRWLCRQCHGIAHRSRGDVVQIITHLVPVAQVIEKPRKKPVRVHARGDVMGRIVKYLLRRPHSTAAEVAATLKLSTKIASGELQRLVKRGAVRAERVGDARYPRRQAYTLVDITPTLRCRRTRRMLKIANSVSVLRKRDGTFAKEQAA